ncbi:MAG: ThiF family adenylyltransferase [Ezakiella sp.]|nr:ThiF family adenylyltransferase [Ezakiella sp.]MDD7472030.1 ThiF family adenylyltransferase [Bacillota bacterium]MDY3923994.1 ThiF family adenylyltransferase [Ezakiella sp.]
MLDKKLETNKDTRTKVLIGEDNFARLKNATVAVVGVGGVGGITAEMLLRAGVGNLILIDFDTFDITNLNRQIGSLKSKVGEKKVNVFKERFADIDEGANVAALNEKLTAENIAELLKGATYIVDACDDIDAKAAIIKYAVDNKIKFISAMGAGNRIDISHLKIAKLSKTSYCPLAKKVRQALPKKYHDKTKVAFYESEITKPAIKTNFVGTISYSPNFMGIRITSEVILDIIGG